MARRRPHSVADDRGRDVDAAPTAAPRAPAEVDVLEVEEHRLVEAAELQQSLTSCEHRAAVRAHRRNGRFCMSHQVEAETGQRLTEERPAPQRRAAVDEGASVPADLARIGGEAPRVRHQLVDEQLEAARLEGDVVVEEEHELRAGRSCALVVEESEPAVGPREHRCTVPLRDPATLLGRACVDNEHLGGSVRLLEDALQAVVEHVVARVVRDDDGDLSRHDRARPSPRRASSGSARCRRPRQRICALLVASTTSAGSSSIRSTIT